MTTSLVMVPPGYDYKSSREYVLRESKVRNDVGGQCGPLFSPSDVYDADVRSTEYSDRLTVFVSKNQWRDKRRFTLSVPAGKALPSYWRTVSWFGRLAAVWSRGRIQCIRPSDADLIAQEVTRGLPRQTIHDSAFVDLGPGTRVRITGADGAGPVMVEGGSGMVDLATPLLKIGRLLGGGQPSRGADTQNPPKPHWRVFWQLNPPRPQEDHEPIAAAIVGADTLQTLDVLSFGTDDLLLLDPDPGIGTPFFRETCRGPTVICLVFPEKSIVSLEVRLLSNGSPSWVPFGSTVLDVASGQGVKLWRLWEGQRRRVDLGKDGAYADKVMVQPGDVLEFHSK